MERRRSEIAIRKSGLSSVMERYTLDNYQTPKKWQQAVKSMAIRYLQNPSGWFMVSGSPGNGKTHICTAICGQLIEAGQSVRYMLWRRDAPRLKAEVNDRESYEKDIGEFKNCSVLYIDDFFKGRVTDADINLAFELLNDRYNAEKITILSSEMSLEDIVAIDEGVGSRIYERCRGGFYTKLPPENWRLKGGDSS